LPENGPFRGEVVTDIKDIRKLVRGDIVHSPNRCGRKHEENRRSW
jgi:hypothetical protein